MENNLKSTDFRSTFNKKGDGEDPIITAQRFLNIFKQLHIFNQAKKDDYNRMLLELPEEIRGMFATLPGGSLLQEYMDDLENTSGKIRNRSKDKITSDKLEVSDEVSKARILANALAEAQARIMPHPAPAPVYQPSFSNADMEKALHDKANKLRDSLAKAKERNDAETFNSLKKEYEDVQSQMKNLSSGAPVMMPNIKMGDMKVVADATFAKEIVSALSQVMQNIEYPSRVVESGSGLSEDFLERALKAVSENQVKSFEDISKTIAESQIKMAEMIVSNENSRPVYVPNEVSAMPSFPPIDELLNDIVKTQTKEFSSVISSALRESQILSTQTMIEAFKTFQKENIELIKSQQVNTIIREVPAIKTAETSVAPSFIKPPFEPIDEAEDFVTDEEITDEEPLIVSKPKDKKEKGKLLGGITALKNNLFDKEKIEHQKETNDLDKSLFEDEIDFDVLDIIAKEEVAKPQPKFSKLEAKAPILESIPAPKPEPKQQQNHVAVKEPKKPVDEEEWEWQDVNGDNTANEAIILAEKPFTEEEQDAAYDASNEDDIIYYEGEAEEDILKNIPSYKVLEEVSEDDKIAVRNDVAPSFSRPEITPTSLPVQSEAEEDDGWEWEYEEAEENKPQASKQADTPLPSVDLTTNLEAVDGGSDDEWEWEYEEVKDDVNPPEKVNTENPSLETPLGDDEWEWEYEEVK